RPCHGPVVSMTTVTGIEVTRKDQVGIQRSPDNTSIKLTMTETRCTHMLAGETALTTIALPIWIRRNWNFGTTPSLLISNKFGSNGFERNRGIPNHHLLPNPKFMNTHFILNTPFVLAQNFLSLQRQTHFERQLFQT